MIMPLLTTMTLLIIFMVNAKWIALTFYFFGLVLIQTPHVFGAFREINKGSFRDNPLGFPDGLNFGVSIYNFTFLLNSLFPGFGTIKAPTIDAPEYWTSFFIITTFMIMDLVHKMGFRKTKGLITLNFNGVNTTGLLIMMFFIPLIIASGIFTGGAYTAENFNSRELFYLQESYSDRKCSPCEQKNAINDARDAILAAL